jgi:4-amino-4-deoxy-L-arabinose transferase-like glycosyltransferase
MRKSIFAIIAAIFVFLFFTYRNQEVPPGINGDEMGIGYNALLLSHNLTDENDNFLPLFIFAKNSDWKQPVTVYATAGVFKIFGESYFWLRATSVLFILISLVLLYLISIELGGIKFFILSSAIFISTPILMIQSHLALENIAPLPFISVWVYGVLKYDRQKQVKYASIAGIALGAGLFSYYGMRLIVPILVLITLWHLGKNKFIGAKHFLVSALPFFALLTFAYFRYPGAVLGSQDAPLPNIYDFLQRYLSNFDISFLYFLGDKTSYHSTGYFGMLLLPTLPAFVFGAYKSAMGKDRFYKLMLISFLLTPLLYGLVPEFFRASRLLALIPQYVVITTYGLMNLRKYLYFATVILIAISYIMFVRDYWYFYPERVRETFPVSIEKTIDFKDVRLK